MKSPKEISLDSKILSMVSGRVLKAAEILVNDEEIQHLQDYANVVSIKRLDHNDHGPVHMRKVAINAIKMVKLLKEAGIELNIEKEAGGDFDDSMIVVLIAGFMHDIGMSVGRENHEQMGAVLAGTILDRILSIIYEGDMHKRVIAKSMITECIVGHMATQKVYSLEAGVILIADGCDMEKGRARIPMILHPDAKVGDIHKYSSSAVESVKISKGENRPIRITVEMNESVGFFQIEEVLFRKINSSCVKPYIELYAGVIGKEIKCYL